MIRVLDEWRGMFTSPRDVMNSGNTYYGADKVYYIPAKNNLEDAQLCVSGILFSVHYVEDAMWEGYNEWCEENGEEATYDGFDGYMEDNSWAITEMAIEAIQRDIDYIVEAGEMMFWSDFKVLGNSRYDIDEINVTFNGEDEETYPSWGALAEELWDWSEDEAFADSESEIKEVLGNVKFDLGLDF